MAFTIAPLLIHSPSVPAGAKAALKEAARAPLDQRAAILESAARLLYQETDLDCLDARELVGLGGEMARSA